MDEYPLCLWISFSIKVRQQVGLYMGCMRRKLGKLCISNNLKTNLGIDIDQEQWWEDGDDKIALKLFMFVF